MIYKGNRYGVRKAFHADGNANQASPVVVTFPYAGQRSLTGGPAFAEKFLKDQGYDAYHVLNAQADWFQHKEFLACLDVIRNDLPADRDIVTYGSSMGGYGALLASQQLGASRVLAFSPQFSIDRKVAPFEIRWAPEAAEIGTYLFDVTKSVIQSGQVVTLHDPRHLDCRQMDLFPSQSNWKRLHLPYCGHDIPKVLLEMELLTSFVGAVLSDDIDACVWQNRLLKSRRDTLGYWRGLAVVASRSHQFEFAEMALSQMKTHDADEVLIARTRDGIERQRRVARARVQRIARAG